jgi:hypothetical protein
MKIVLISGKARHGKDSAAGFFQNSLERLGKRSIRISFADYVKFLCAKHYGWNGEKDDLGRKILQDVATDIRAKDPNFWVDTVARYLRVVWDDYDVALIADWRYPNEFYRWRDFGVEEVVRVRVRRRDFESGLGPERKSHSSETSLEGFEADLELEAKTLEELEELCGKAVEDLGL